MTTEAGASELVEEGVVQRPRHLEGRARILRALREDLVGPVSGGKPVDTAVTPPRLAETADLYGPLQDAGSGEEILVWERPALRYGVGVLFPAGTAASRIEAGEPVDGASAETDQPEVADEQDRRPDEGDLIGDAGRKGIEGIQARRIPRGEDGAEADMLEVETTSNRPSSIAVTLAVPRASGGRLLVRARGGRYEPLDVRVEGTRSRRMWRRLPWESEGSISVQELDAGVRTQRVLQAGSHGELLTMSLEAVARPVAEHDDALFVTIAVVNRSTAKGDERAIAFQVEFDVTYETADGSGGILPYPGPRWENLDDEERSNRLLYRALPVFAVGHGCSADWDEPSPVGRVDRIRGVPLPVFEVPSISPDVEVDGEELSMPMAPLAGLIDGDDGLARCERILDAYGSWIERTAQRASDLSDDLREVSERHLGACRSALASMREGLTLIHEDAEVRRAFRFANRAILTQQVRSVGPPRMVTAIDAAAGQRRFDEDHPDPDLLAPPPGRGAWRAFQLAFLLSAIPSVASGSHPDRDTVELIWFPTGGGKTEAYLGLIAFSAALRRLRDRDDVGTDVLMRYTLRLLTAQQFQRASALITAMEALRLEEPETYGQTPFRIGIWVGNSTTPGTKKEASARLKALQRDSRADNPFLVTRCPWCRAQIGVVRTGRSTKVIGYDKDPRRKSVRISCTDAQCRFSRGLPILVVDEDIYETPPTLIIGTVDKFAMLAWRPMARSIFGIGPDGERSTSPPGLIIQDELHLISGPLGTMVGLFETVIDELCTDRREGSMVRPKVVSSTATTRSYLEQVRALFARERTRLFPPPGIDADDSFFARYARYPDGSLREGRMYVGVHATNHNSMIATQVATLATMFQTPLLLEGDQRDPWWTSLVFFNNLRELGSSLSLIATNVPAQLKTFGNRAGVAYRDLRRLYDVRELTSRLQNHQVPEEIGRLEREYVAEGRSSAVDVCLASNIIEVGIDIDRLSLMAIVGQPKSAAQYIQVSGRVGRRWPERPGLVVTIMNPRRPRDRSHYERFREFHQTLYASVEPSSVTPFAPSAVDRGISTLITAAARNLEPEGTVDIPHRTSSEVQARIRRMLEDRVAFVDPSERQRVMRIVERRLLELTSWGRMRWDDRDSLEDSEPMIVAASSETGADPRADRWRVMQSLRNVDAECEVSPILYDSVDDEGPEGEDAT